LQLGAGRVTGPDHFTLFRFYITEDNFHGFELARGQAGGTIRTFAQERGRIVVALFGIADDAVFHAVEGIAGIHDGLMQGLDFGLGERRIVLHELKRALYSSGVQMNVRIRGSADGGGVEILGELGDFDEALPSTGGAAVVIGILRSLTVERRGNQFRFDDGLVHGAIREIGDLFGMAQGEHAAATRVIGAVSGIIRCHCVSFAQGSRHGRIADRSGPSAVSDHLQLSIPVFGGQKDGGIDERIGRRRQHHQDAAVGWHGRCRASRSTSAAATCRRSLRSRCSRHGGRCRDYRRQRSSGGYKRSRWNELNRRDGRVRKRQPQLIARSLCGGEPCH
jgi:hypothetical protein